MKDKKSVIIVAGPNVAGKTTFIRQYLSEHQLDYISADDIAMKMRTQTFEQARIQAGKQFYQNIDALIKQQQPFIVESTLSGITLLRRINDWKKRNYQIIIIFLFIESANTCILRVKERVQGGGHHVPEADITRRYRRSINNFWQHYRLIADKWHLFYNARRSFYEISVGSKDNHVIINNMLFEMYQTEVSNRE